MAYLDDTYSETIIARNKRDYVWIMARTPSIPQAVYDAMVDRVRTLGYATEALRRVPQKWPEPGRQGRLVNPVSPATRAARSLLPFCRPSVLGLCQHQLCDTDRALAEGTIAIGQIELPQADEVFAEVFCAHLFKARHESLTPCA